MHACLHWFTYFLCATLGATIFDRDWQDACFRYSSPLVVQHSTSSLHHVAAMARFFRDLRDRSKELDVNMTDQEIDHLKRENNRRLKRAFDDIFKKYNRDFGNTGDEIDLEKEEIIVNNGHILHMHHDRDAGKGRRARRLLTSLATGAPWDEDDFDGGHDSSSEEDAEEGSEDGSEKDADGETEEDSEDDLAGKANRSSTSRATSEPSYRTNPTSAEDSNATPQAEDSDDGFDPLSRDEYSASAKHKHRRRHISTARIAQQPTKRKRQLSIGVPVFTLTQTPNEPSEAQDRQLPLPAQAVETTPNFDEEPNSRPRKKRRTEPLLEIPIWTRPDMPHIPIPKTAWDRHWSRKRNPMNRTFDEEGNQTCTWKDIQRRQRKLRGLKMHPLMAAKMTAKRNGGVAKSKQEADAAEEADVDVKLEHTCLSEDVATTCPACEQEARVAADEFSEDDDDAIIDPEVADAFLTSHTCLSGNVAAPCAACEEENEAQGNEEEVDFVGVHDSTRRQQTRGALGKSPLPSKESQGESGWEDCTSSDSDSGSDPDDYDWENNPDLPRPQYVTRIIKYYSKRKPFTPEEDQVMIELIENQAKGWDDVMEAIPGRSRGQLQYRYYTELRSAEWQAKQSAAREANKEIKRAEKEKNRTLKKQAKRSIQAVQDLAGTVFEKPLKKPDPKWKEQIEDEDFKLQPLDPCILPPPLPEEECPSPTFHPTVPLIELVSFRDIRDSAQLPVWRQAPQLPAQVEGVPMEPIPPLSLLYETPYANVYPHAQYNDGDGDYKSGDETEPEHDEHRYDTLPVGLLPVNGVQPPQDHVVSSCLDHRARAGVAAGPSYTRTSSFGIPAERMSCIQQMAQSSISSGYSQSHYSQLQSALPPTHGETPLGFCNLPCCQPHPSIHGFGPAHQPQLHLQHNGQAFYRPGTIPDGSHLVSMPYRPPGSQQSTTGTKFYPAIAPRIKPHAAAVHTSQPSPVQLASTPPTALGSSSRPSTASTRPSTPSLGLLTASPVVTDTHRLAPIAKRMVQNTDLRTQTPSRAATESPDPLAVAVKTHSLWRQTDNPKQPARISPTVGEFGVPRKISGFNAASGPTKAPYLRSPPGPTSDMSSAPNSRSSTVIKATADNETASTSAPVESPSLSPSEARAPASAPISVQPLLGAANHSISRRSDSPLNLNPMPSHTLVSKTNISAPHGSESERAQIATTTEAMTSPQVALDIPASATAETPLSKRAESHSEARSNTPRSSLSNALVDFVGSAEPANTLDVSLHSHSNNTPIMKPRTPCVDCRIRKVKCNKKLPCTHCVQARIECISQPGPRSETAKQSTAIVLVEPCEGCRKGRAKCDRRQPCAHCFKTHIDCIPTDPQNQPAPDLSAAATVNPASPSGAVPREPTAQVAASHSKFLPAGSQPPCPELGAVQLKSTTSTTTPDQPDAEPTPSSASPPVPSTDPFAHLPPHLRPRPEYLQAAQNEPVYDNSHQRFVANKYAIAAKGAATRRVRAGLGVGKEKHLDTASVSYYKPSSSRRENKENVPEELAKWNGVRRLRSMEKRTESVVKERETEKVVEQESKSMANGRLPLGVQRVLAMEGSKIQDQCMSVGMKDGVWGLDEIRPDDKCSLVGSSESDAEEVDLI